MSYIAVGVGVAGLATSVVGGIQAGNAAKKAARAQQEAAQRYADYVSGQEKKATDYMVTPASLAAHHQALQAQEDNVRRQEDLAASMQPALVDAGRQATQLLQGKAAPVLNQIQNQRQMQRQQMLDNLRTQLGPGAETSSAGMQALQKFDMDTANMLNETQQSYLDKVSGIALNGTQTLGQALNAADSTLSNINANGPQETAAKMILGFTGQGAQAEEAKVNSAGGEQKGAQLQGQMLGQVGGTLMQGAAMGAAMRRMSPSSPAAPGTPTGEANPYEGSGFSQDQMGNLQSRNYAQNIGAIPGGSPAPGTLGASLGPRTAAAGTAYSGPLSPGYSGYSGGFSGMRPFDMNAAMSAGTGGGQRFGNVVGGGY